MGYHPDKGRMYFRGTDGNSTFSTETGERIELSQALTSAEEGLLDTSSVKRIEGSKSQSGSPGGTIGSFEGELLSCQNFLLTYPSNCELAIPFLNHLPVVRA